MRRRGVLMVVAFTGVMCLQSPVLTSAEVDEDETGPTQGPIPSPTAPKPLKQPPTSMPSTPMPSTPMPSTPMPSTSMPSTPALADAAQATPMPSTPASPAPTEEILTPLEAPGSTVAQSSTSEDDDSPTTAIVLAVLLAALVLGNIVVCAMRKSNCLTRNQTDRGSSTSTTLAPALAAPKAASAADSTSTELEAARSKLAAERSRREYAEAIIARAKPGGLRMDDFPKVRDVVQHVEILADTVLNWTSEAYRTVRSHAASPVMMKKILLETYVVCKLEVKSCLDDKMRHLSAFIGVDEPVTLLGDGSMNLDTQYVLYECLAKNYRSIVPPDGERTRLLANTILKRCEDENLAERMIFGDSWLRFEALLKDYLILFVECALQNPPLDFVDNLDEHEAFDPVLHREWAYFDRPVGDRCFVVFPPLARQTNRSQGNFLKAGVVRIPS